MRTYTEVYGDTEGGPNFRLDFSGIDPDKALLMKRVIGPLVMFLLAKGGDTTLGIREWAGMFVVDADHVGIGEVTLAVCTDLETANAVMDIFDTLLKEAGWNDELPN